MEEIEKVVADLEKKRNEVRFGVSLEYNLKSFFVFEKKIVD